MLTGLADGPIVIATWKNEPAIKLASEKLLLGARALDAIEAGVRVVEADAGNSSVGYGGMPDAEGNVTLDACIMDEFGNAGSVTYLQHIKHPVSVARRVMEQTPHVLLSGKGALQFALAQGFSKENLLTPVAKAKWQQWKKKNRQVGLFVSPDQHDTVGMLALDQQGRLAGACSTSGLAFKLPGRVGDSPLIGSGLFVDNEVGAATATGLGEEVIKVNGSFLIVELMRQGRNPEEACREALHRIAKRHPNATPPMVGFVALRRDGAYAACANDAEFAFTFNEGSVVKVMAGTKV